MWCVGVQWGDISCNKVLLVESGWVMALSSFKKMVGDFDKSLISMSETTSAMSTKYL